MYHAENAAMTAKLDADVAAAAAAVLAERGSRRLGRDVRTFIDLISTVPDHVPGEVSSESLNALRALAEDVIDFIEEHLAEIGGRPRQAQELASSIYQIRKALERIDYWERHYRPN